jgi:hypothetical protein
MTRYFVIMPSATYPAFKERRELFNNLATALRVEFNIPDYDRAAPNFDIKETIATIKTSDGVIADLSFERPSCYFELGIAEAVNANIALVAVKGTVVHQTSLRKSVFFYENMDSLASYLRDWVRSS